MNSRERIKAAIARRPTDRIPVDMGAVNCTGININAYIRLKQALGICTDRLPKMHDLGQQLAYPDGEILDRLGVDCVQPDFCQAWTERTLKNGSRVLTAPDYNPRMNPDGSQDWLFPDGTLFAHMTAEAQYFDVRYHPLAGVDTVEALEQHAFAPAGRSWAEFCANRIRSTRESTDRAVVFTFGGNILEAGTNDFGYAEFMELLLTEPALVHRWARKKTDQYLENLEMLMPLIADQIDVIAFGDDLGTQCSTLISPAAYRALIHPYHKEIYQYVKRGYPQVGRFLHSCGAIEPLIPYLIEEGIQILNPVQISASGMDPRHLKRTYGKDLVFWGGGANMQNTVLHGTVEQIEREVRGLCEIFYEDGTGFVFNQVHNILGNVPPEKVLAIYDTVARINREL